MTAELRGLGLDTLADSYSTFYLSGWDYFLSGFTDTNAYRAAIQAGTGVLTYGAELGRQWLAENSLTRESDPSAIVKSAGAPSLLP